MDQMDLIDIYRSLYPTVTELTCFSLIHGSDFMIDLIYHAMNLSDCQGIKLVINNSRNYRRHADMWILNYMLLNKLWSQRKTKGKNTCVNERQQTDKNI